MNKDNKLLTIGQFAAMHGINKKTLMWYDEIGLFKPASINPDNSYRCYNYHQSPILETILLLRELEVPINEVQNFMKNRSAQSLKNLLDDKIADLDSQLMHLQTIRTTLCTQRQHMITLMTMDLSEIRIRADYCRNGKLPFLTYQSAMHTTPGGKYLRAFHKGSWDKIPERYEEIFAYAQTHNLVLYGYSYEMGIKETVVDNIEDYIVQIEIPVTEI